MVFRDNTLEAVQVLFVVLKQTILATSDRQSGSESSTRDLVEAIVELGDFNAARAFAKRHVVECELRDIDTPSFGTVSASATLGLVFLLEGRYSDARPRYE